ncbi:MAG: hypothetical protein AAFV80_05685 [Bacteroidota bacterium]
MYNFLIKRGQTVAFALGALISIIFIASAIGGVNSMGGPSKEDLYPTAFFDTGLFGSYFLLTVAIAAMVIFGVLFIANNFKASMKGLIFLGVMLVIFFVAYSMGSEEITPSMEKFNVDGKTGKAIGAAISTMLIMGIGALVLAAAAEIWSFFK